MKMEATRVAIVQHVPPACPPQHNSQAPHNIHSPKRNMIAQLSPQSGPAGPASRSPHGAQIQSPKSSPKRHKYRARKSSEPAEPAPVLRPTANVVHVTGFPNYTQTHDIVQVFSRIGAVQVDKIHNKVATLSFTNAEDAKLALQQSKKLSIFGEVVTVVPFNAKYNTDKPQTPKKDMFMRSKKKDTIVDPKNLDLTGEFYEQAERVLAAVRLTQEEVNELHMLYADLENALREQWPDCKAIPFGSITTGLGVKSSDADCFVEVPVAQRNAGAALVNRAKRLLQQYPKVFAEIISIPRANTPIVKFFHIPTEMNCDVNFKTPLGVQNSKLIAFLLHADPRFIPMAVLVKYWAKVHGFSGTGKLTNYTLTMMIIFYLQQPPLSMLPSVAWLQRVPSNDVLVDYWNTGFACDYKPLPPSSNTSSISELLGGFFEFYSMFNFDEMVICPYLGYPIKKDTFKDLNLLPMEFTRYKYNISSRLVTPFKWTTSICVQDPFEQSHNVASSISSRVAAEIRTYFKFAANIYEKEKLNNCVEFLKKILLSKPKVIRGRTHPEYRVNLFPRIVVNIINPDWKSVVRDVVLTIFEKMLKLKLGKVEEKVNPDSRKEKEKYMGAVTRAIWRRKQFSKLYSLMKLGFQQKEERITEEILNVDKNVIDIQYQLTVTYCHEPKSAVVSIKMTNGDVEAFKDFGKFYISVMQDWFMALMRPFSRPVENNTAAKIAETIRALDSSLDSGVTPVGDSDDEEPPVAATGDVASPATTGDVTSPTATDVTSAAATGDVTSPATTDVTSAVATDDVTSAVAADDVASAAATGDVTNPAATGDVTSPAAVGDVTSTAADSALSA